ncbi:phenoloxidase-activating factor 2-like [Prorops nasuta]|uniref:phenoloxidase-activating factor 2-like n=1 Tax=Prorops nasuta TaxID=863751 RepID=UPI0034CF0D31
MSTKCSFLVHLLIFLQLVIIPKVIRAQSDTIIFAGSTTTTTRPPPAMVMPTTKAMPQCICVPTGTCQTTGIDIRIVNTGVTCSPGNVYCCQSSNIVDGTCGLRKIQPTAKPVGQASFGQYPWQAVLLMPNNAYVGSGVLINANHLLTVAHKVVPYLNGGLKIRLGEWDAKNTNEPNPYVEFSSAKIFVHPNFNSQNLQNDVAVIRLNGNAPIATAPNINTACLSSSMPQPSTRCWVSGWGKDAFGATGNYQSIMKEVDVPIVSQPECEARLRATRLGSFFVLDKNSFICAGGEAGKDACTGDGGSPLVCQSPSGQWQVIGMVAWGIGCAGSGVPGVYVNVINFLPWIVQQTTAV